MKKLLRISLFALILFLLPSIALAATQITPPTMEDGRYCYFGSSTTYQGETYLLCAMKDSLFIYQEDTDEFTRYPFVYLTGKEGMENSVARIDDILSGAHSMYAYSSQDGAFYQVQIQDGQAQLTGLYYLDTKAMQHKGPGIIDAAVLLDNQGYMVVHYYSDESYSESGDNYEFFQFDITTGKRTAITTKLEDKKINICNITPYQNLLICQKELPASADPFLMTAEEIADINQGNKLVVYNPAEGVFLPIEEALPNSNIAVNMQVIGCLQEQDILYLKQDNNIYAARNGQEAIIVGKSFEEAAHNYFLLSSGDVLVSSWQNLTRVTIHDKLELEELTVCFDRVSTALVAQIKKFEQTYPTYKIKTMYKSDSYEVYTTAMSTQDDAADAYLLSGGVQEKNAIAKGYYLPLADKAQSNAYRTSILSFADEWLFAPDGILAAVPLSVRCDRMLSYNVYAAQQLGLTEDDLPKTFEDFVDFVLSWEDTYGAISEEKGIALCLGTPEEIESLIRITSSTQLYTLLATGYQLTNEQIQGLIALFEKIDEMGEAYDQTVTGSMQSRVLPYVVNLEANYLFDFSLTIAPGERLSEGYSYEGFEPVLLRLLPDEPPVILLINSVLVGNPYSAHQEGIKTFLNFVRDNPDDDLQAAILAEPEPVTWQTDAEIKKNKQIYMTYVNRFDRVDEATQQKYREIMTVYENEEALRLLHPYRISPELIKQYQSFLRQGWVIDYSTMSVLGSSANHAWYNFGQGTISGSEYINTLISIAKMYQMEGY